MPSKQSTHTSTLAEQHKNDRISSQEPRTISIHLKPHLTNFSNIPHTYILLINRSLFTGLPFFPPANLGVSVHISFTFSNTILQCLSNAFTRASSLRLLRQEMRTWVCDRTAVWRMDSGPLVNSCCSSSAISYSLMRC
jgi:hypothetical protein